MSTVLRHPRGHRTAARVIGSLAASVAIEVVAVNTGITDNILWPPTTLRRGLVLTALLLAWVPVMHDVVEHIARRSATKTLAGTAGLAVTDAGGGRVRRLLITS
jgi:hypothetical protein